MEIIEGKMPFMGYETYYRIVGQRSKKTPLVLLHGGPGSSHNYFEVLDKLAEIDDRLIIMYDQLGCGKSSIPMITLNFILKKHGLRNSWRCGSTWLCAKYIY